MNAWQQFYVALDGNDDDKIISVVSDLVSRGRYSEAASYLENADAELQAVHDKTGFLAVGEDLIVLPGVSLDYECDRQRDWFVPGTSDAIEDEVWQAAASNFAAQYNKYRNGD